MPFIIRKILFGLFLLGLADSALSKQINEDNNCKYVNPFFGNADNGHTFPGACIPFGMIQVSPESGNAKWRYCSGFNLEDDSIMGFSQNHLNGTGCADLGDILMQPFSGEISNENFKSKYNKKSQKAFPGFYEVHLTDFNVDVELTATQRTAFHRYTYNNNLPARLLIDLHSGLVDNPQALNERVLSSEVNMPDNFTITGQNEVNAWVQRKFFFVIKFDKPYVVKEELSSKKGEKAKRFILEFDIKTGEAVQAKVSISTVSIDGAMASLNNENPNWDFKSIQQKAHETWNKLLSKVTIKGTMDEKTNFYTALYHLYIQPNNIADVNGQYRGANDSVFTSTSGSYFSTFSLWDTYRAAHPLYTILNTELVDNMILSLLEHQKTQGFLPIWTLWGKENYCMIANHAIPVVVDAYMKGFKGFDAETAYQAIKESATVSHKKSDWDTYMKYGYYPYDIIKNESVSRTLESAYDDYCVAQMAKQMGKNEDYEYFSQRANFYKNLFDPQTKLMRAKDSNGNWRSPFDKFVLSHDATSGGGYTEGNAWQYTWQVQHDVTGLINLMGGKKAFATKLDSLFALKNGVSGSGFVSDVTGLIGQYAQGNEPSHHVAYLYNYVDQSWKTQNLIREIFDTFYLAKPDGLCGNDDCGQMSAWYVFSAMGFYPVNPISGEYIFGAPQIKEIKLSLPNGKFFIIKANGLSRKNKYIKSISLNDKPIYGISIKHEDIMRGGILEFNMTSQIYKQKK